VYISSTATTCPADGMCNLFASLHPPRHCPRLPRRAGAAIPAAGSAAAVAQGIPRQGGL